MRAADILVMLRKICHFNRLGQSGCQGFRAADILFRGRKSVTSIGAVRVPGVLRAAEGFFVGGLSSLLGRKLSECSYIHSGRELGRDWCFYP